MNDKKKRILALIAVAVLLIVSFLPMIFAFRKGENSRGEFMAVVAVAIFVPIFSYVCLMIARVLKGRGPQRKEGIRNVVFDVGNVLMLYDWQGFLKSFGYPEEKYNLLADGIFCSSLWNERDKGEKPDEEYIQDFVDSLPGYESEVREILKRSDETMHPVEYSVSWLRFLREQGCRIYILSNYSRYTLDLTKKDMDFLAEADGAVFSCDVHLLKPEPEIYRYLLEKYNLKAEECVFIDDRQENCDTAEAEGMHSIHFVNFPQAAKELEKMLQKG